MSRFPPIPAPLRLNAAFAMAEAERCLLCHPAPCEEGCAARVPVRRFIRRLRWGDFRGAIESIKEKNIFPGVCARVCYTEEQCQARCILSRLGRPVDIGALQRFLADWEMEVGPRFPLRQRPSGKRVAVLGAGPAGLSAAAHLALLGHEAFLFEREKEPGGALRLIPPHRLPPEVTNFEIGFISKLGVRVQTGSSVHPSYLLERFDAVVFAPGLSRSLIPDIPGTDLPGCFFARDVLAARDRGTIPLGKHTVVIGGGNTSLDAATRAIELGASEVTFLYRRSEREMPAWGGELERAKRMGVIFRPLTLVEEILGDGKVEKVRCRAALLGERDPSGRKQPIPAEGGSFFIPCDSVILAVGEEADRELVSEAGLALQEGRVLVNAGHATEVPRLFAAGDVIPGPRTVVKAVEDGKRAAQGVHLFLRGKPDVFTRRWKMRGFRASLVIRFLGKEMENPFLLAAGPSTDDEEMVSRGLEAGWAGAVLKTTSLEEEVLLKYPMLASLRGAAGEVAGLGNIDLMSQHHADEVEARLRRLKKRFPKKLIAVSVMGKGRKDWQTLASRMVRAGADYIECSYSCPQGTMGSAPGAMLGQDPRLVKKVTAWVKEASGRTPVVVKITPQVTDIGEVARAAKKGGADGICCSNTVPALMGIDPVTFSPLPSVEGKSSYAGLSGPAVKPLTLRAIAEVKRKTGLPITGTGGPITFLDALEFLAAGASTVQFCTAVMLFGFDIIEDLQDGLMAFLSEAHIHSPADLTGRAIPRILGHPDLSSRKVLACLEPDACIGCGRCFVSCLDGGHNAITFTASRKPAIQKERCVGCGLCTLVCPIPGCIELEPL